jgi:SAM-dependent methyltransferase
VNTWAVTSEEQARYLNRGGAVHRLVHEERYERMRAPFTGHLSTATAIGRAGRVTLTRASADQLPPALGGPFDAILTVNSVGFWPAPAERLGELRRRLRPGGRIAIASQSRPGAKAQTARDIEALLQDAGYTRTRAETLALDPPVVCVLAVNPDPDRDRGPPGSDPRS